MAAVREGYFLEPSVLRDEVYQSNVFLQARKDFDLLGMRLFLIALSGINPHFSSRDKYYDKEFKYTFIPTAKLTELLGSSKYLGMLPKACVKLQLVSVKLKNTDEFDNKLVNLFKKVDYKSREGLYIRFNDHLRPHFLDLLYAKKGYTRVELKYLLCLTSLYAVRLLELLLQFQNIPHYKNMMEIERKLTVEQLRFMLNVPEHAYKGRMDNFKRHVLDIPIKEINERTPYFLRYKAIKKGTKVIGFKFTMATHNVPYKIGGKKPQFSNDAIDQLRAFGFNDESARAIYNCCNGVDDCLLRLRRATALLRGQEKNVKNRLGFLRRSIEQDWHSSAMVEKEDPRSKPGWSATIDFHSRRPGVPLRGPNKPVDKPPNYLPSDKMDKKLADAIAQGEFYTPVPTANENDATEVESAKAEQVPKESSTNVVPSKTPAPMKKIERAIKYTPAPTVNENDATEVESPKAEQARKAPPLPNDSDEDRLARQKASLDLMERCKNLSPEERQRVIQEDFDNEMRELAEKKAREREEFIKRNHLDQIQSDNGATSSSNDSSGFVSLESVLDNFVSQLPPEKAEAFRAKRAEFRAAKAAKEAASSKPTATENAAPPPQAPPKVENAPKTTENGAPLSKIEIVQTGISTMLQLYKKISAETEAMETEVKMSWEEGVRLLNEKRALEQELIAKGELSPPPPPPIPERIVNITLPPPPPPDFQKNAYRFSKKEKIIQKGINELIELYTEANANNEEPERILARTIDDTVEPLKSTYDTNTAREFLCLNGENIPIRIVTNALARREIMQYWRMDLDFFAEYKMTPVEAMRRYIKTYGYLPPRHEPSPREWENLKKGNYRDLYTGKLPPQTDSNEQSQSTDPTKSKQDKK